MPRKKKDPNESYILTSLAIPTKVYNELREKRITFISVFRKGLKVLREEALREEALEDILKRQDEELYRLRHRVIALEKEKNNEVADGQKG